MRLEFLPSSPILPCQVTLTRKDQLAVAAALQQKHPPEEEDEPGDEGKKP